MGAGAGVSRAGTGEMACPPAPPVFVENGAGDLFDSRAATGRPLKFVAIGSSSTLGVGASAPTRAYPAQLALDLSSQWGLAADVRNAGVAGETSSATLARLLRELASGRPDLIIWQVGTNDAIAGVDPADFRANLEAGVTAARAQRVPMILVDPQFSPRIVDQVRYQRFVAIIGEVGAKMRVPVFSRFAMMRAWGAKSAAALNATLSSDGFHMDDQGYACLAKALAGDIAEEREAVGRSAAAKL
jgi:lysophospholipase L1-like esterase